MITGKCKKCGSEIHNECGQTDPDEWFNLIGIGNEGVEMLHSGQDLVKAANLADKFCLRARMNGHRKISVYSWSSSERLVNDDMKTKQQLAHIMANAEKIS